MLDFFFFILLWIDIGQGMNQYKQKKIIPKLLKVNKDIAPCSRFFLACDSPKGEY